MGMILQDANELAKRGIREINLIAQDLAAYGTDFDGASHFRELLENLVRVPGAFRIRLLYIHPDFYPDWLPSFVKEHEDKVMPYFDIPMQHASPDVLRGMGRKGDPEKYLRLIESIRSVLPEAVIRTTIMVGFPGEEAKDVRILKEFLLKARIDWMGVFCYSREEGTKAWKMRGQKEHDADQPRARRAKNAIEKLQVPLTVERLQRFVGNVYPVLVEEKVEGEDLAFGRIYAQAPDVDGLTLVVGHDLKPGMVVRAGIKSVKEFDLEAVALEE
jgi:ribosomal protein S12 methylthiotransferase